MKLIVERLCVSYGATAALRDVSLEVGDGEMVALVGANGSGKSTLLRCVAGLTPPAAGSVRLAGRNITGHPAHRVARAGLSLVPEGRQLFYDLTVAENLRMGLHGTAAQGDKSEGAARLAGVGDLFPTLTQFRERRAGLLSGGQQQMLAIARSLMRQPAVLLLDEPSLGLAPLLVREIFTTLEALRSTGVTVLLAEQNAAAALRVADRGVVIENGRVVLEASAGDLLADPDVARHYLGAGVDPGIPRDLSSADFLTTPLT